MEAVRYAAAAFSGLLLSWLVTFTLARTQVGALDRPNERSLHVRPVPRTGGIAVLGATVAGWLILPEAVLPGLLVVLAALALVSLADDVVTVPVRVRLPVHLAAAAAAMAQLGATLPWWMQVIGILAIAWMINLYNFMDGSDGLAGGMALFGFLAYAAGAWMAGATGHAAMNAVVAAAAAGFLVLNFHPARIFLGDVGSVPLGFLAAVSGLYGWTAGLWPLWFPVLVFSPFVVDASVTLARRLGRGDRVWQAHRDHYYQRLVQLGWGHRRTAYAEYGAMAASAVAALVALRLSWQGQVAVLAGATVVYAVCAYTIGAAWRRRKTA